jgi:hypothetical protein
MRFMSSSRYRHRKVTVQLAGDADFGWFADGSEEWFHPNARNKIENPIPGQRKAARKFARERGRL